MKGFRFVEPGEECVIQGFKTSRGGFYVKDENGEISFSQMKKEIKDEIRMFEMNDNWFCRMDRIIRTDKGEKQESVQSRWQDEINPDVF